MRLSSKQRSVLHEGRPRAGRLVALVFALTCVAPAWADEPKEAWRAALEHGLPVVQRAARNYPRHRECFACHHQTFPLLAMHGAKKMELPVDRELERAIVDFTRRSFERQRERLLAGRTIDGAAITVAYGLWTLTIAGAEPDALSDSLVINLLKIQDEAGSWSPEVQRPPLEESKHSCTALAVYGLKKFARATEREEAERAIARAARWMEQTPRVSHEDHVARLWAALWLEAPADELRAARADLLARQKADGGWSQLPDMASDAYSTGQTLWTLRQAGVPITDERLQRAVALLVRTQRPDGSWYVKSRATPVQTFFDNGDPYGEDQFISITATGWALAALSAR